MMNALERAYKRHFAVRSTPEILRPRTAPQQHWETHLGAVMSSLKGSGAERERVWCRCSDGANLPAAYGKERERHKRRSNPEHPKAAAPIGSGIGNDWRVREWREVPK